MTDDRGQILLLSALAACACLLTLAACLYSVSPSFTASGPSIRHEALDNVIWVQDLGLARAAGETGGCQWEERSSLADSYKSRAYLSLSSIERNLLTHGIAYSFAFNESLARKCMNESDMPSVDSIGGILIKREGDNASVYGCAYDVSLADGSCRYRMSTVKNWN